MSSSSVSSTSFNRGRNHFCRCGLEAVLMTCTKVDNYGRKFFRCPRNRTSEDCKYFRWTEDFALQPNGDQDRLVKERIDYLVQLIKIVIALLIIVIIIALLIVMKINN